MRSAGADVRQVDGAKKSVSERGSSFQRSAKAVDINDVNTDANDHSGPLLDRDRLGQITRLVDVETLRTRQFHPEIVQRNDR